MDDITIDTCGEATYEELEDALTPPSIASALEDGLAYVREEDDETQQVCFPNDQDPGCQMSYINVSVNVDEWNVMSLIDQATVISNTMLNLVEEDPDTYIVEMTYYAYLMGLVS